MVTFAIPIVCRKQAHITANVIIVANGLGKVSRIHGTFVAAAINGIHLTVQHDDVSWQFQRTFVVAAKDGANVGEPNGVGLHIEEYGDETNYGNAVAAAIHRADMSATFTASNANIDKRVLLYRLISSITSYYSFLRSSSVNVGLSSFKGCKIRIVTIAATIDVGDGGVARETNIGIHFPGIR